jgi:hypothetical protein
VLKSRSDLGTAQSSKEYKHLLTNVFTLVKKPYYDRDDAPAILYLQRFVPFAAVLPGLD